MYKTPEQHLEAISCLKYRFGFLMKWLISFITTYWSPALLQYFSLQTRNQENHMRETAFVPCIMPHKPGSQPNWFRTKLYSMLPAQQINLHAYMLTHLDVTKTRAQVRVFSNTVLSHLRHSSLLSRG